MAGALAAMFGGFAAWMVGYFYNLPATLEANTNVVPGVEGIYLEWARCDALCISSIWGVMASVLTMLVVSLATQKSVPPNPLLDADGNPLSTEGWLGLSHASTRLAEPVREQES